MHPPIALRDDARTAVHLLHPRSSTRLFHRVSTLCLAALLMAAAAGLDAQMSDPAARFASNTATDAYMAAYSNAPAPTAARRHASLAIPVAGIRPDQLRDTFEADRSGGRDHNAIDIHAPRGTPVLAAADGRILRLHSGSRGGLAVYHLGTDGRTRFYYAHLDRYEAGIERGATVRKGDVIGYVGDTGNAAPGDFHLHFSIAVLDSPSRWWEGTNLNPYPLLLDDR